MTRDDMIIGEYYLYAGNALVLFNGVNITTKFVDVKKKVFRDVSYEYTLSPIRPATAEETHWLKKCIEQDRYIEYDEAMKSFKNMSSSEPVSQTKTISKTPAYVRCIYSESEGMFKKGVVYRTHPGVYCEGSVYLEPDNLKGNISLYPLDGGVWKFEPCNEPETSSTTTKPVIVFGKFNIGDIVVSLSKALPYRTEGDLFAILENSSDQLLFYRKNTHSMDPQDWRLATTLEVKAYYEGVKNISEMKTDRIEFFKDEYIVVLKSTANASFPENYVFKQRQQYSYLRPYKDAVGSDTNGLLNCTYGTKDDWRYATAEEIAAYNAYSGPVNVTKISTLGTKSNPIERKWAAKRDADHYTVLNRWANNKASGHTKSSGWIHSINYGFTGHSGDGHYYSDDIKHPDHVEITFEEFKRDILKESAPQKTVSSREVPKYVKCVDYAKIHNGEIFCTDNPPPKSFIGGDGWYERLINMGRLADGSFVPSTKEEYENFIVRKLGKNQLVDAELNSDPYTGKTIEQMLVICNNMFPVGSVIKIKTEAHNVTVKKPFIIQYDQFISNEGFPIVYDHHVGKMYAELVSLPSKISAVNVHKSEDVKDIGYPHKVPSRNASPDEILAYCKAKYPKGTVVQGGYVVTDELTWTKSAFISHSGIPMIYTSSDHSFIPIIAHSSNNSSTKAKTEVTKMTPEKISLSVKHQEPVVVHNKKAKRSKLVIINK